ncbi:MAG: hypothetical protein ABFD97_11285 [Syntrophobacter sp.]
MKAAMVFTGSGPILVLTTFESLETPEFIQRLAVRGISKFIAYEVALETVQARYGSRFSAIRRDLSQTDDLRVLDIDGHHVFNHFSFEELGPPKYSPTLQGEAGHEAEEEKLESEWVYAKIDEYGKMVEASYIPMIGSQIHPSVLVESGASSNNVRFQIDDQGNIINAFPQKLNGRKLILHGKSSPALGRTDTVMPSCTWKPDSSGDWMCA